jgi:hypothetical protein
MSDTTSTQSNPATPIRIYGKLAARSLMQSAISPIATMCHSNGMSCGRTSNVGPSASITPTMSKRPNPSLSEYDLAIYGAGPAG